VIIGGGFGGLAAAQTLRNADAEVTVIDRTNHHIFQPLLYQVATAALAPSDITAPIRWILRRQQNTTVLLGEISSIDVDRKIVSMDYGSREIPYDYLIVATGSRHAYFGHEEWEPLAPGLKAIEDATEIRRRFLLAFERAEKATDETERDAYLTFVIVGGGPTGVELSGALPMIARKALYPDFRHIDTRKTRVILLEGGPRILPTFPESLASTAQHDLSDLGVEVHTSSIVTRIERDAVYVGDERYSTRTVFWAAGNVASPPRDTAGAPSFLAYELDRLFRPDTAGPELRAEAGRIILRGLGRTELPAEDRAQLVRITSSVSGLSAPDAERRVTQVLANARTAASQTRKTAVILGFSLAAALLAGAAAAWMAAGVGGKHRDGEFAPPLRWGMVR